MYRCVSSFVKERKFIISSTTTKSNLNLPDNKTFQPTSAPYPWYWPSY